MRTNRCTNSCLLVFTVLLCWASPCLAENPAGVGPQAASDSIRRFTVADGLEATLFASEPLVRNPTDMDVDERGHRSGPPQGSLRGRDERTSAPDRPERLGGRSMQHGLDQRLGVVPLA